MLPRDEAIARIKKWIRKPETLYTLQVHTQDCTGCGLCVEACPVDSGDVSDPKAINRVAEQPPATAGARSAR